MSDRSPTVTALLHSSDIKFPPVLQLQQHPIYQQQQWPIFMNNSMQEFPIPTESPNYSHSVAGNIPENLRYIEENSLGVKWTEEQIKSLIHLYRENKAIFDNPVQKKTKTWTTIAGEINQKYESFFSGCQCDSKFRQLKKKFRDMTKKSGGQNNIMPWLHYDDMYEIFGDTLANETAATSSSMDQEQQQIPVAVTNGCNNEEMDSDADAVDAEEAVAPPVRPKRKATVKRKFIPDESADDGGQETSEGEDSETNEQQKTINNSRTTPPKKKRFRPSISQVDKMIKAMREIEDSRARRQAERDKERNRKLAAVTPLMGGYMQLFASQINSIFKWYDSDTDDEETEHLLPVCFPLIRNKHSKQKYFYEKIIPFYSEADFKAHFRLTRASFSALEAELRTTEICASWELQKRHGGCAPTPIKKQLLMFLWYAGNKEGFRAIADRFGSSMCSTWRIIKRITDALLQLSHKYVQWPAGSDTIDKVRAEFRAFKNFPNIIGAIGACHIPIHTPSEHPETYLNRKNATSIILQGVCDTSKRFTNIYCGWPGSCDEAHVLSNSDIFAETETLFPDDTHLIGSAGYPLMKWLIVPFEDNGELTKKQHEFNDYLNSTRTVIEHTFGLLKGRWRKLQMVEMHNTEAISFFVHACCVLHNYCLSNGRDVTDDETEMFEEQLQAEEEEYATVYEREIELIPEPEKYSAIDKRSVIMNLIC